MTRELKFRAWDGQTMRYDVTGFEHGAVNEMAGVFLNGRFFRIDKTPVMQFTGLKDKNGVEIYEGDICEPTGDAVGFRDGCFYLGSSVIGYMDRNYALTVIGNIYENPELTSGNPANVAPVPIQQQSGDSTT